VAEKVPLLAIMSTIDHVAGIRQRGGDLAVQLLVVLDYQYAHGTFPGYCGTMISWRRGRLPSAPGTSTTMTQTWRPPRTSACAAAREPPRSAAMRWPTA